MYVHLLNIVFFQQMENLSEGMWCVCRMIKNYLAQKMQHLAVLDAAEGPWASEDAAKCTRQ